MSGKNLFDKPFDDGTLVKLTIYKEYLKEWLPVFVSKPNSIWKTVQIFDFFAGMGKDKNGIAGSPLIAIEIINTLKMLAFQNGVKVILHLNELKKESYEALVKNVEGLVDGLELKIYNIEFKELFERYYESMKTSANFLFLDQSGIKEITKEVFIKITSLKQTDFLFFISSSFFKRFSDTSEFKKYFPFDKQEVQNTDYYHIHRKVLNHYKSLIDASKQYFLAPFSIAQKLKIFMDWSLAPIIP